MKKKKLTLAQKKAIFCVKNGHSRIVNMCFGYVTCARCDQQIGDALGGAWSGPDNVIVGHNCETCRANLKKLRKKDTRYFSREELKRVLGPPKEVAK